MKIRYSSKAYHKVRALVKLLDTEIGWHGTTELHDNIVLVKDIFVYPQTVTSCTVRVDDEGMIKWLAELDNETFNSLRMWGHSHNSMGVFPSDLDLQTEEDFIKSMPINDYYCSHIINKRGDARGRLYLKSNNGAIFSIENKERIAYMAWHNLKLPKKYIKWAQREINKYVRKV